MKKFWNDLYLLYRLARRRVVVFIRDLIRLDEDDIRDQLIGGLRQDNEALVKALSDSLRTLASVEDRLTYHEKKVPSIKESKKHYDRELRRRQRKAEAEAAQEKSP